jgi:hypothetical protein
VDNIILLALVELGSSLHRSIAVVKARGCKHEFDTREFTIGQNGISLIPVNEQATLPLLPIESYSSVMSRAPSRDSPRRGKWAREIPGKLPQRRWQTQWLRRLFLCSALLYAVEDRDEFPALLPAFERKCQRQFVHAAKAPLPVCSF